MNNRIQLQAGRSSFPSLVMLFGLALLSFNCFAQAPNPPLFTALDGQELDPNPAGRYGLDDATRGLPFTVNTPTPPQITAEQIVTPSTIGNYINTPGLRLILEPGNYGNMTISGTDQEIVLTTGVSIGQLTTTGQRIIVRADPVRTGNIDQLELASGTDLLIDGVYQEGTTVQGRNHIWNCARLAVINSRIRQVDFAFAAYGNADDVIIANNYMETYGSAQTAVRLHSIHRLAFVDNFVRSTGGNGLFRLHANPTGRGAENLYVGRNLYEALPNSTVAGGAWFIRPSSNGQDTEGTMGATWVEGNNTYASLDPSYWYIVTGGATDGKFVSPLYYNNNRAYVTDGGHPTASTHPWTGTFENNTISAYTDPPAWEHQ